MKKIDTEMLESFTDNELIQELQDRGVDARAIKDFDGRELQRELESRGYYVDANDPDLSDWPDADIAEYLEQRGYKIDKTDSDLADYISDLPPYKLKDLLCDVVGVNHHTSKEDLVKLISERF